MTGVSTATAAALEAALQRLLDDAPTRTDGELTIAKLAREAGVSRAAANRATDIVTRLCAERDARTRSPHAAEIPAIRRARIHRLQAELAELWRAENQQIAELRRHNHIVAPTPPRGQRRQRGIPATPCIHARRGLSVASTRLAIRTCQCLNLRYRLCPEVPHPNTTLPLHRGASA
jgi:hypothetical protein